jgi:hypothetical protein
VFNKIDGHYLLCGKRTRPISRLPPRTTSVLKNKKIMGWLKLNATRHFSFSCKKMKNIGELRARLVEWWKWYKTKHYQIYPHQLP